MSNRIIVCAECGRTQRHHGHDLCAACFGRRNYIPKPKRPPLQWTSELHDRLCEMWAAGRTISAIATALNCTLGQIAGRLHRSDMLHRGQPRKRPPKLLAKIRTLEQIENMHLAQQRLIDRMNAAPCSYDGPTTMDRLQAMHDKLDAALAEYTTKRAAGILTTKTRPVEIAA